MPFQSREPLQNYTNPTDAPGILTSSYTHGLYDPSNLKGVWINLGDGLNTPGVGTYFQLGHGVNPPENIKYHVSRFLDFYNFNFNIPDRATIRGITFMMYKYAEAYSILPEIGVFDYTIQLFKSGFLHISSGRGHPAPWSETPWQTSSYGGSTDMWGLSLTPAEINASSFGVGVSCYRNANTISYPLSFSAVIDSVLLRVNYDLGPLVVNVGFQSIEVDVIEADIEISNQLSLNTTVLNVEVDIVEPDLNTETNVIIKPTPLSVTVSPVTPQLLLGSKIILQPTPLQVFITFLEPLVVVGRGPESIEKELQDTLVPIEVWTCINRTALALAHTLEPVEKYKRIKTDLSHTLVPVESYDLVLPLRASFSNTLEPVESYGTVTRVIGLEQQLVPTEVWTVEGASFAQMLNHILLPTEQYTVAVIKNLALSHTLEPVEYYIGFNVGSTSGGGPPGGSCNNVLRGYNFNRIE